MPRYCISSSSQLHLWCILSSFWIWLSWIQCLYSCVLVINSPWDFLSWYFKKLLWNIWNLYCGYICVCVSICVCVPCMHVACVGFRGQFVGVSSVLIPRRSQGLHSSHHTWKQALLPTEPSHQPTRRVYKWRILCSSAVQLPTAFDNSYRSVSVGTHSTSTPFISITLKSSTEGLGRCSKVKSTCVLSENTGSIPSFHRSQNHL